MQFNYSAVFKRKTYSLQLKFAYCLPFIRSFYSYEGLRFFICLYRTTDKGEIAAGFQKTVVKP